jgi:Fe-S-cluster-containing dehydrogenase component
VEGVNMAKWAMVIDISRCTGCYSCFTACKDEYWDNDYLPYSAGQPKHGQFWMNLVKQERGIYPWIKVAYIPVPCMQCDNAPCIKAAKGRAVYKRPDGIVVIDPKKAVGQKQIVNACPYGVIFWNEDKKLPQKCTFCIQRLEESKAPKCVQVCPSQALIFGDLDDPKSEVSRIVASGKAEVLNPEEKTKARVYYLGLPKVFIAGSAVFSDIDECAEGVKVILTDKSTGKASRASTNNFGDFEFDGLSVGKYSVKLEYEGYQPKMVAVNLKTDRYLGAVRLSRARH